MKLTPRQLEDALADISEESFALHQELAGLVVREADEKLELMRTCKSGKEVDMRFAATETGKRIAYLKVYLKGLSHKRTALIEESKNNRGNTF